MFHRYDLAFSFLQQVQQQRREVLVLLSSGKNHLLLMSEFVLIKLSDFRRLQDFRGLDFWDGWEWQSEISTSISTSNTIQSVRTSSDVFICVRVSNLTYIVYIISTSSLVINKKICFINRLTRRLYTLKEPGTFTDFRRLMSVNFTKFYIIFTLYFGKAAKNLSSYRNPILTDFLQCKLWLCSSGTSGLAYF